MPKKLLSTDRISEIDYVTLHDGARVVPQLTPAKRKTFKLANFQFSKLGANEEFPKEVTAKMLVKAYNALGFLITSPRELFLNPGDKTLDDLAQFISKNHLPRFDSTLGDV